MSAERSFAATAEFYVTCAGIITAAWGIIIVSFAWFLVGVAVAFLGTLYFLRRSRSE